MLELVRRYISLVWLLCFFGMSEFVFAHTEGTLKPKKLKWPFEGFLGTFDRISAQRGAKVYFEVCGACHGLNHLYYRNLIDLGFSEEEIKELASYYSILDGPDSEGELYERPALISDHIVSPYKNDQIAKASNNGAFPPDLSLIIKARHDGANYVFSLLTGYGLEVPEHLKTDSLLFYNPYFEGGNIAMAPPLSEGLVTFLDDTESSVEQMAKDVVIFLQWASEPEMEKRKEMGLKVLLFLFVSAVLFYLSMRSIWRRIQ